MCGFVGLLALGGAAPDRNVVRRMTETIRHRGPDDSGEYYSGSVGFGFRRLSILDLSPLGHQPMCTPDGRFSIVFNGEIYNYRELRRELQSLGYVFHSTGDTEVLLLAYVEWGAECVSRLNGMWAFLVHDCERHIVFGSRDRFGIKPLYLHRGATQFVLASEIKAIKLSGLWSGDTDWSIAADYLVRARLDETRHTFYTGIEQLPPGTCFELTTDGKWREWRFWSLEYNGSAPGSDPAGEFAELFEDAIRLHMRSDVPVGVHLSGGLDSTSIICSAARVRKREGASTPLMAFSYIASEFDETAYINDTLQHTGAHIVRLGSEPVRFWCSLTELMWHQDEPFHSVNLLVSYELMRLTAQHGIKVVLNGQGADETLAGYPSYFRDYWNSLLRNSGLGETWREIGRFVDVHGGSRSALMGRQLKHYCQGVLSVNRRYRRMSARSQRSKVEMDDWFVPELCSAVQFNESETYPTSLRDALSYSISRQPLPLYLRNEDRISMAHSVESRVPFLDHRLVSFALRLPENWLMRGPWNKYLLREAMKERIPESVRSRPQKFGFPVPARDWMSNALYEPARALIASQAARERGIYNTANILRDLERHRRGEIDVAAKIFNVVQFETWSELANWRPIPSHADEEMPKH